ncbi:putative acetyl-CoA hydrolase/transferase [Escherichia coli]|nr:putative acetyl-CoA hydrolase/transferase [Escherichia coli]
MGVFRRNFCRCKVAWGNINNAVMARLGENPVIPPFMMYSEVLQESVVHLLETGKISGGQRLQPDNLGRFPAQDLRQYGLLCQPHCVASAGDFQ